MQVVDLDPFFNFQWVRSNQEMDSARAKIEVADLTRMSHGNKIRAFVNILRNYVDVQLWSTPEGVQVILKSYDSAQATGKKKARVIEAAGLPEWASAFVDSLELAAEAIRKNRTAARPTRLMALVDVTRQTIVTLKLLATLGEAGFVSTYNYRDSRRELPALAPAELSDLAETEPAAVTINELLIGISRNWREDIFTLELADHRVILPPASLSADRALDALRVETFVTGVAADVDGMWVLQEGFTLVSQSNLY